jgi:hypothetical protein
MFYTGVSGRPYSTTYNYFDANGDGATGNDLVYVPASQSEVVFVSSSGAVMADQAGLWATFDSFIKGDPGLNDYRGKIVPRNSSRTPWYNGLDARLAQDIPVPALDNNALQLTVDVINVLNLINSDWGKSWYVSSQNDVPWALYGTNFGVDPTTGQQRIVWTPRPNRYAMRSACATSSIEVSPRPTSKNTFFTAPRPNGRGAFFSAQAIRGTTWFSRRMKSASTRSPVSVTSRWLRGVAEMPAARLVMQEMPARRSPRWRAQMASETVDIPTASAPRVASMRISAGVS